MASSAEDKLYAAESVNASPVESVQTIATDAGECAGTQQKSQAQAAANDTESGVKRKRDDDNPITDGSSLEPKCSDQHPLYKTSLCSYFRRRQADACSHGDSCRFAHSEDELRPRPDGSLDPTSERAKKGEKWERVEAEEEEDPQNIMMTEVLDSGDPKLSKCLVHLPRKWSSDQMKTFLDSEGVQYKSVKKKKGMTVGFISFDTGELVNSAVEVLHGNFIGNKSIKVADVIPRSCDDKIRSAQNEQNNKAADSNENERDPKADDSVSKARSARDVVTPLAHLSYSEQLVQKKNSLSQILKRLTRNARKACPTGVSLPEWIVKSREIGGLPCELEGIIESPLVNGYRNKCEFSVGLSMQGKPTVGFMLGNFREGVTAVEEPTECPNVSEVASKYALLFQQFLQDSALQIWNRFNNSGFWRQLTVREGRSRGKAIGEAENPDIYVSEVMLMVQVNSVGVDDDLVNSEFEKMSQAFAAGASSSSPSLLLTALVVQDHQGISNVAPADCPLRQLAIPRSQNVSVVEVFDTTAEARIHDYINNLCFSISPTAFFQVNTLAAEKLYSLAGEWAGLGPDTLLFDVCCGTGTIGLTLANRVGMVVGIEMNASAVADAERNAKINGIDNCKFICSKAEDVMGSLLKEYLNVPELQDETLEPSKGDEKHNAAADLKIIPADNESDTNTPLNEEIVRSDDASEPPEKCGEKVQNHPESAQAAEGKLTSKQQFKNVVAIVDPPRGGLHPTVTRALRTHPRLRRLVYISCNPETLVANAIELCTPTAEKVEKGNNRNQGWRNRGNNALARQRAKSMPNSLAFQPVKAMAVDLFPHTPHCEMVMLLER